MHENTFGGRPKIKLLIGPQSSAATPHTKQDISGYASLISKVHFLEPYEFEKNDFI